MTAPFVQSLRARPEAVVLGAGFGAVVFRVEISERWDVVKVVAQPAETVERVKIAALEAMMPGRDHRDWMMKLNGATLAESETLLEAGAKNGSTFLLTLRRRQPVR